MRLHVGVIGAEQRFHTLNGEQLHGVHVLTAPVVTPAGVAFRILVGHNAALGFHHPRGGVVFRSDELDVLLLPEVFLRDSGRHLVVEPGDCFVLCKHLK